ncbi:DUF4442 domain-containing protein [Seonamhaeicola maritimus]|uniref:DUF4442 domain-containing protein n=1 Tax=Seonamhaeicola maritimus TaxID=2591822 RepID=A0A5C7GL74_9FLAO|nr:DUF4442 domain-containing protein [Seonamhaeicola maritimus]TXG39128.1 DUF4442 domain-containing protein [Seonamhaeicola maritimus]
MKLTPRKLNAFSMFKLPAAYICGVRVKQLDEKECMVSVKYRWINQNPFKSMFWAVQGMAAELSTASIMIGKIQESGKKTSMLVISNEAKYTKKATGRINFTCNQGKLIDETLNKAIDTGEGQTIWLTSVGVNEEGIEVSTFNFEWSVKVKN